MATAQSGTAEEASISILKEDSGHVELAIRIRDLVPKKGFSKFLHRVKKGQHPQELVANATFTKWLLTSSSLEFEASVQPHPSGQPSLSKLQIRKFPSDIEDQVIEVRQPPGRNYSFLILRARKRPPATDWKRFLTDNGTLDACRVDEDIQKEMNEAEKKCQEEKDCPSQTTVYSEPLKKTW